MMNMVCRKLKRKFFVPLSLTMRRGGAIVRCLASYAVKPYIPGSFTPLCLSHGICIELRKN